MSINNLKNADKKICHYYTYRSPEVVYKQSSQAMPTNQSNDQRISDCKPAMHGKSIICHLRSGHCAWRGEIRCGEKPAVTFSGNGWPVSFACQVYTCGMFS